MINLADSCIVLSGAILKMLYWIS